MRAVFLLIVSLDLSVGNEIKVTSHWRRPCTFGRLPINLMTLQGFEIF